MDVDGRLRIGGRRVQTQDTYSLVDPYRGNEISSISVAEAQHVDDAVAYAVNEGLPSVQNMHLHERVGVLRRAAELVLLRKVEYAELTSRQTGKPIREAVREIQRSAHTLTSVASAAEQLEGSIVPTDVAPGGEDLLAMVIREPVGVVVGITPFNSPFNLAMHKVAPAIATGNAVILKPAPQAVLSAHALADLLVDAGLPPQALQVVTGGPQVGQALVSDVRVGAVSFTGSVRVGNEIARSAGFKRLVLELGGNSPNVVHSDADVGWAATALAAGSFSNSGQNCNSVQRVFAHQDIYDHLSELLVTAASQLRVGDPLDMATDLGTLIDEDAARRVSSWISEAVDGGAALLTGGIRHGASLTPTVLSRVPPELPIACEEVFGPVVVVAPYSSLDQAIEAANSTAYGLQASVFTSSLDVAFQAAHRLRAGGVLVNRSSNFRMDHLPFGGMGVSGLGREGGRFSMSALTQEKTIIVDASMTGAPHPLARKAN